MFRELVNKTEFHERLKNPLVAEWTLSKIDDFGKIEDLASKEWGIQLFDEPLLRHLLTLTDEENMLMKLFNHLPAKSFRCVQDMVFEQFPTWSDIIIGVAAPKLAQLAPETAYPLFLEKQSVFHSKLNTGSGILEALPFLQPEHATQILSFYMEQLASSHDNTINQLYLPRCLSLAWSLSFPSLPDMFAQKLTSLAPTEMSWLPSLYNQLTAGLPFFDQIQHLLERETSQSFSSLSWMFRSGVPLADVDRLLNIKNKKLALRETLAFLQQQLQELSDPQLDCFVQASQSVSRNLKTEACGMLASFLLALLLAKWLPETWSFADLSLDEVSQKIGIDLPSHPCLDSLLQRLRTFPSAYTLEHWEVYLEESIEGYGISHFLQVIKQSKSPAWMEHLLSYMDRYCSDDLAEDAAHLLCSFGELAEQMVISRWDTLDGTQQIYSESILEKIGGKATVPFLLDRFKKLRGSIELERWCNVAKNNPDLQLIRLLEPELKRKQWLINDAFLMICLLLDYQHPKIDELQKQYKKNAEEIAGRNQSLPEGDTAHFSSDTISLEMECSECHGINRYDVSRILLGTDANPDDALVGEELHCLSCEQLTELSLTTMGKFSIMTELLKMTAIQQAGREYHGFIKLVDFGQRGSLMMSPKECIKYYKEQTTQYPQDAELWLILGNCYRSVGWPKHAHRCYEQCFKLNPACPEAALQIALFFEDNHNKRKAFQVLSDCITHFRRWQFYQCIDISPKDVVDSYMETLFRFSSELDAPIKYLPEPSEFEAWRKQLPTSPSPPPKPTSSSLQPTRRKPELTKKDRAGRNDPCPCGSGKKYKKCCLSTDEGQT